ncbi:hypothetical protein BDV40DRAFT_185136 [Aspergillus tamarii]|uniref:Uncharacterized protein n=1 Tax=Aspergillus tamarii TaxID=41984 RepID=A0A5N6URT5_ASPTM|nr:hypothetical protein BDV40DRAFT_185136 [Aspergillus tamarii]
MSFWIFILILASYWFCLVFFFHIFILQSIRSVSLYAGLVFYLAYLMIRSHVSYTFNLRFRYQVIVDIREFCFLTKPKSGMLKFLSLLYIRESIEIALCWRNKDEIRKQLTFKQ